MIIKPLNTLDKIEGTSIFLAGSIEMDTAEKWQDKIANILTKRFTVLNPRRDDWDTSWIQEISNKNFREQVEWELAAMDIADFIIMYFDKNTKSPITLLELGLYATSDKLVVCCPDGFWRKGNVDIVCKKHNIITLNTFQQLITSCELLSILN